MVPSRTEQVRRRRLHRWLAAGLWAGLPWVALGCGSSVRMTGPIDLPERDRIEQAAAAPDDGAVRQVVYRADDAAPASDPPLLIHRMSDSKPEKSDKSEKSEKSEKPEKTEKLPPASSLPQTAVPATLPGAIAAPKELPITLDAVFRVAEQSNPRIGLAREKLHESLLQQAGSCHGWLPNVYAGIAYYRHEGGIQDFTGRLIHSSTGALYPGLNIQSEVDFRESTFRQLDHERKVWQQKAELSQVNSETLLDAATTYVDLLTARRGEALAREIERYDRRSLERAERLAKNEPAAEVIVQAIRASMSNRQGTIARLQQQGNAAAAKLVYLLGLSPDTCLKPVDPLLAPIELVDAALPACDLVTLALTNGPGVRELEGILAVIQEGLNRSYGPHNLLPTVQVNVFEGLFGAGPGASLAFDNRLDVGVQLRWNITALFQAEHNRDLGRSKHKQAMYTYHDLRGKLAAGVQESRDAILSGREQIGLAIGQVRQASEAYRLSDRRLEEGVRGATEADVVLQIRSLELAHFNHLQAIAAHNRAQVKLLLLLGPQPKPPAAGSLPSQ
ncbi:MAG: TolC family protein [Gemmataceae bacterium]